jgi:hypothetical protein
MHAIGKIPPALRVHAIDQATRTVCMACRQHVR